MHVLQRYLQHPICNCYMGLFDREVTQKQTCSFLTKPPKKSPKSQTQHTSRGSDSDLEICTFGALQDLIARPLTWSRGFNNHQYYGPYSCYMCSIIGLKYTSKLILAIKSGLRVMAKHHIIINCSSCVPRQCRPTSSGRPQLSAQRVQEDRNRNFTNANQDGFVIGLTGPST